MCQEQWALHVAIKRNVFYTNLLIYLWRNAEIHVSFVCSLDMTVVTGKIMNKSGNLGGLLEQTSV